MALFEAGGSTEAANATDAKCRQSSHLDHRPRAKGVVSAVGRRRVVHAWSGSTDVTDCVTAGVALLKGPSGRAELTVNRL